MWFSFDGETFEVHESEEAAKAEADQAMEFWAGNADEGWDEVSTQVCYGKVTHAVKVTDIPITEDNEYLLRNGITTLERHDLVPVAARKVV